MRNHPVSAARALRAAIRALPPSLIAAAALARAGAEFGVGRGAGTGGMILTAAAVLCAALPAALFAAMLTRKPRRGAALAGDALHIRRGARSRKEADLPLDRVTAAELIERPTDRLTGTVRVRLFTADSRGRPLRLTLTRREAAALLRRLPVCGEGVWAALREERRERDHMGGAIAAPAATGTTDLMAFAPAKESGAGA